MTVILCVVIAVLGMALNELFYKNDNNPMGKMMSIFNAYTQFSYLILGFLFVQTFAKDYPNGVVNFYKQLGYSLTQQYICKFLVMVICTVPCIDVVVLICNFAYGNNNMKFLLIELLSLTFTLGYIILLAMFVASILKNTVKAVLVFFGLFVLFNIINIVAWGLINPADGNSIVTFCMSNWAGRKVSHYSLDRFFEQIMKYKEIVSCFVPLGWCMVMTIINTVTTKIKNRCL